MKRHIIVVFYLLISYFSQAQQPSWNAVQIHQAIKKLEVLASVLYVAAHPDDENTRLIAYLANEKLYRTGYLSLTRGDGGQNLIGDEQGVELGLIRTQELLSARKIDGGEQFFSSAYDFGFSKTPEETFQKWDKEKILSDVVWIIRKFKPDIIITRFPTTGEGGHGHHTASAILANEAFNAAADSTRFSEQLAYVKPWQAKRILWNTFNFGGNNTTSSDQFKLDVGGYNAYLGKSYGEIAATSRSQHKTQGFGSAASRGTSFEYFKTTGGTAPVEDLVDDVDISWSRLGSAGQGILKQIKNIDARFDDAHPEASVSSLVNLYTSLQKLPDSYWKEKKLAEIQELVKQCSGLFIDIVTNTPYAVQTDSLKINWTINNRLGTKMLLKNIYVDAIGKSINASLDKNINFNFSQILLVSPDKEITQPYWLREKMDEGHFHIDSQQLVGIADVQPAYVSKTKINVAGYDFIFSQSVQYRNTDPVKGETYQPVYVIPPATVTISPSILLFDRSHLQYKEVQVFLHANTTLSGNTTIALTEPNHELHDTMHVVKGNTHSYSFMIDNKDISSQKILSAYANHRNHKDGYYLALRSIDYDHIPSIKYFYVDGLKVLNLNLKTAGKNIGYITGAGDKVPEVLEQMGYNITMLDEKNIGVTNLSSFDAIITGVRAYNTNAWLNNYYDTLMHYIRNGGNLIVQYNTSTSIGPVKAKIGPYPFDITRNRITNENAPVQFIDSPHRVLHYPNEITSRDFEDWIQERSIYHAANWDEHLQPLLSMADPGEVPDKGSLLIGKYGKGYFVYTGLVFYRELPAAVPGALRLIANIIALNQSH